MNNDCDLSSALAFVRKSHVPLRHRSGMENGRVSEKKKKKFIYHIVFDALASMPLVPVAVRVQCLAYKYQRLYPFFFVSLLLLHTAKSPSIKHANKTLVRAQNTKIQLGSLNLFIRYSNSVSPSDACIIGRTDFTATKMYRMLFYTVLDDSVALKCTDARFISCDFSF